MANKNVLGGIALLGGMTSCVFFLVLLIELPNIPIGLPCQTSLVDGALIWKGNTAYVAQGNKSLRLAYHAKTQSIGPMNELLSLRPNSSINAEFCGRNLVRVVASGQEIYRLDQTSADHDASIRNRGLVAAFLGSLIITISAVFVLKRSYPGFDLFS